MTLWHRTLLAPLLLFLATAPGAHAENFALQVAPSALPASSRPFVERFLREVETLLPPTLKQHLSRTITVRFEALDSSPALQPPACIGDQPDPDAAPQTLALVRKKSLFQDPATLSELVLSTHLLPVIESGSDRAATYTCGHRNLYRLALASAAHEIAHIYDYADLKSPSERRFLQRCSAASAAPQRGTAQTADPDCRKLKNRLRVSNRPEFLDLMGWVETGLVFHRRGQSNQNTLRSPDPYEFKNWKESFAVNFEYFLLDPEFACRRPAVHSYYTRHFQVDPHPTRRCRPQTTLTLSNGAAGGTSIADIRPDRIYEIHALFAGRGPQLMSRWGHSLYRLVVCAPERTQTGPECLNDVAHHVAISFRANISDAAISYWKGIKGDYPSLLFAQPFLGVIEEYNKNEFRELTSLPLRLTPDERTFFLHRVLEAYWEYGGRYKFITNNCATEALNFLKGTLGESRLSRKNPLTPLGLHKTLQKLGIVDASVLADPANAVEKGYYYASKKPEVEKAFSGVLRACAQPKNGLKSCNLALPETVDDYLNRTSAQARRQWYEHLLTSSGETPKILGARFFLLESYVQRRAQSAYNRRIARVLEAGKFDDLPREAVESAESIRTALARLREIQQLSLPSSIASDGYGIPIRREGSDQDGDRSDVSIPPELLAEQRQLLQVLTDWAKTAFGPWTEEMAMIQKNRLFFLREMRRSAPAAPLLR